MSELPPWDKDSESRAQYKIEPAQNFVLPRPSCLIGESSDLILKIVIFPEKCGGRVLWFLIVSLILQTNGGVPIAAVPRDEKEIRWKKNCQ